MYGKVAPCTVAVRGHRGTVGRLDGDTDYRSNLTRPVEADSIVVKALWTVLGSSHDGVPLKWFKIIYRLVPLSTPVSCRWAVPLKGLSHMIFCVFLVLYEKVMTGIGTSTCFKKCQLLL